MILKTEREGIVSFPLMLGIAAIYTLPHPSGYRDASTLVWSQRLASVTTLAATSPKVQHALTARQMVTNLRDGGMPISAIAEATRVERKTIYSWLQGSAVRADKIERLENVHALMVGVEGVGIRDVYRFWRSKIDAERTLRDLLLSDDLGSASTRSAVAGLKLAALKAIETEKKMSRPPRSGGFLDEIPEAVSLYEAS